jgi:hypothetical protein
VILSGIHRGLDQSAENLEDIRPYFTSKQKGSGLGRHQLSIIKRTADISRWNLWERDRHFMSLPASVLTEQKKRRDGERRTEEKKGRA